MTKNVIILETLERHSGHMLERELYETCHQQPEFWAMRRERKRMMNYESFQYMVKVMQKQGLVERVKTLRNRYVVVLTSKGKNFLDLKKNKVPLVRRRLRRKLASMLYDYASEDKVDDFTGVVEELRKLEGNPTLVFENVARYYWAEHLNMRHLGADYTSEHERKSYEKVRDLTVSLGLPFDEQRVKRKGERLYEKWLAIDQYGSISSQPVGQCYFCGYPVTRMEAVQDANLLRKHTGCDTAVVCCSCYAHLQWIERYLDRGGEKIETSCRT